MPEEATQLEQTSSLEPISVLPDQAVSTTEQAPEVPLETLESTQNIPISAPTETSVSVGGTINLSPAPVETPPNPAPTTQPVVVIQEANPSSSDPLELRRDPRSFLAKALEKIQFRKRVKLDKILKLAMEKRSITNDQVEKLLHVSDATASRYLARLVKEGKLQKIGKDGSSMYEAVSR